MGKNLYIFGGNQAFSSLSTLKSLEYADISNYIVSVDYKNNQVINHFILHQNHPNSFKPTTIINYQLSAVSQVDLSIYNILGQKEATLVAEKQPVGTYSVEWDATGFTSGVYLYRLDLYNRENLFY